jgi:hypothetical protein
VVGLASFYNFLKLAGGLGEISYGLKRQGKDSDIDSDFNTNDGLSLIKCWKGHLVNLFNGF